MTLRFGTDGVRGVANLELTPELVLALGRAAARVLEGSRFLVGRDTRVSGPLLEAALAAGLASEGADVELLGVAPTPAVAWLAAADGVPAAMISASHNPFPDNGVKLFAAGGRKLSDETEARLEAEVDLVLAGGVGPRPRGTELGRIADRHGAIARYVAGVYETLDGRRLDGLHVVLDCAHGAATEAAPAAFAAAGATVTVVNAAPDGCNINDGCGSTHPHVLAAEVAKAGADCGLAFDGDADRLIAVGADGTIVDGDRILALCARDLRDRGRLKGDTVVVTVMSNLGFRQAMADAGIGVVETAVGDRYVLDALDSGGLSLGGEQSGHVIFRDLATTGDGILTGLQLLDLVARSGEPLAALARRAMQSFPQVLRSVVVASRATDVVAAVRDAVDDVEAELGESGRVLIRPSGTEPVVRVMVEAATEAEADRAAARLVAAVEAASADPDLRR